jgi:hypothetical protein
MNTTLVHYKGLSPYPSWQFRIWLVVGVIGDLISISVCPVILLYVILRLNVKIK